MEPELSAAADDNGFPFPYHHHVIIRIRGGDYYLNCCSRPQHQTYSNSKEKVLLHQVPNKVICSTICTRGCRDSRFDGTSMQKNAKLVSDSRIDMTGCTKSQTESRATSLPASRDDNVNVRAVRHHFPSIISFVENLPLVGNVSHITTPESTNGCLESSGEGSSTSKAFQDVHISARLMEEFMELASANTKKNLETCGILGAFLKDHTFYVTTLILPKQESTANSCQALNEEEIHAIQDGQSLFPVGWIHTHPSQTCFLSSIDLHTIFVPGHAARGNRYCYGPNRSCKELWNLSTDRPRRNYGPQRVRGEWGIPPPPGNLLRELLQRLRKSKFKV